jgi:hypothetical protein
MTLRKLTIVPMLAMALFAVGCGADCESMCEDSKECDGASDELKDRDCAKSCEEGLELAEKAGCEDQYDDLESCMADVDDLCKVDLDTCKAENAALTKCMTE